MKEVVPMARKIAYRAVGIDRVTSAMLASMLAGATKLVVAIDVAKTKMMSGFGREDGGVTRLVKFESPTQTRAFVDLVVETSQVLAVPVEAVMEPTGTYGDALRELLRSRGVAVFMTSPKRVHDAAEVFDGVPSMHDAKACVVLSRLHEQHVSRRYVEPSAERVRLRALVRHRELYDKPLRMHLGVLEGLLARHWPELLGDMDVWRRKTPLELLTAHPCPADVLEHWDHSRELMRRASRNTMKEPEAQKIFESAMRSVGVPATEEIRDAIRAVASEALRVRVALDRVDRALERVALETVATRTIAPVVGRITAVVLVAELGPLSEYQSAAALEKACGLNLKTRSSGNYVGRLAITKRGSGVVRRFLYLAAVRLVKNDALIAAWSRARSGRGRIAIVAVMRKLVRALWHVARGAVFDSSKLVDERALPARELDRAPAPTSDDVFSSQPEEVAVT
jgi:transposase